MFGYQYKRVGKLHTVITNFGVFTAMSRERAFRLAQVAERRAQIRRVA